MFSRREFIQLTALSTGSFFFNPFSLMADKKAVTANLLFSQQDIPELKKRLELPLFKNFWQELIQANLEEDQQFLESGIQFNNQLRHLPRVADILQREAFIYALTQDKKRGELARLAVQKILQFKKWDYFLEAGKYVIGLQRAPYTTQSLVLTYEWIEDVLTEAEKKEIMNQLPEKGCEPCYRSLYGMLHQDEVVGWGFDPESSFFEERDFHNWPTILSRTNLRAVPMSALTLGAIFLKDSQRRTEEWLRVVRQSYENFVDLFAPDGSYPEGTGYCNYTSSELILMLEVIKRKLNEDWSDKINWRGVMDFFLLTKMPSTVHPEGHVDFGDGGSGFGSDVAFWVAKKYHDATAQYAGNHFAQRHKASSVVWYDAKIPEKKPGQKWYYRHFDIGWLVVSTGFEPDDFIVALRSGKPANHEHADRNSLLLKCYAENLLVDIWHPPYDHKHPAWALRTSPAHNTVLVDGKGHQYHDGKEGTNSSLASAQVVQEKVTENYVSASSDATHAYQMVNPNVEKVIRTFLVIPDLKFLMVLDTLATKHQAADFTARWFVSNEDKKGNITFDQNRFVFNRPTAKLIGMADGNLKVILSKNTFPVPEEHGVYPFLDIGSAEQGKKINLLCAMVALKNDEPEPSLSLKHTNNGWRITAAISGKELKIELNCQEMLPEISVQFS